jgi:hypothetical protein
MVKQSGLSRAAQLEVKVWHSEGGFLGEGGFDFRLLIADL